MKAKKGFTLIELLAVIVILAVIALIATPMIMGVIDEAREGAARSSAYAYIHAVENKIAMNLATDPTVDINTAKGDLATTVDSSLVKSGAPSKVNLIIDDSGTVKENSKINVNGYGFKLDSSGNLNADESFTS